MSDHPLDEQSAPPRPGAAGWVRPGAGLEQLRQDASGCQGCELHQPAGQTVFSTGAATARVVLVGEQPGDQEDRQGAPFVGPAGRLLDRALAEAGLDRRETYVTNAVKHFRFQPGAGGRRVHQTPGPEHVRACAPWLAAELALLDPRLVVALGSTAGKALLGPGFRVTRQRGLLLPWPADATEDGRCRNPFLVATVHPSAVLRAEDSEAAYRAFVADLRVAAAVKG